MEKYDEPSCPLHDVRPVVFLEAGVGKLIYAAITGFLIGIFISWFFQAKRYDFKIEKIKHQHTSAELVATQQAVKDMAGFQKGLNDALQNFSATTQRNAEAQQSLDSSLRDLRSTTAGMRGDFSGIAHRISGATQSAAAEYATACTALLENLAERGGQMAERGAEISRKADGHAADAALMLEAWPSK